MFRVVVLLQNIDMYFVMYGVQNSPYVLALWRQAEYWYLVLRLVQNWWWYLVSALSR